eukprot:TRINITY_DN24596_c0_g1_i2.p1 TRINITY_DN24596_c0_g1~~TRINITY_DN24596_c0_g1_i2.p1  ORF type:complete len:180 (-),score=36.88 TRINITY_DN24596_c0_g1_i2:771-1310(-)
MCIRDRYMNSNKGGVMESSDYRAADDLHRPEIRGRYFRNLSEQYSDYQDDSCLSKKSQPLDPKPQRNTTNCSRNELTREERFETFQAESSLESENKLLAEAHGRNDSSGLFRDEQEPIRDCAGSEGPVKAREALNSRLSLLLMGGNANANNADDIVVLKQQLEDARMEAKLFKMVSSEP